MLAEHRRALREAFARHGGVDVGTDGTRSSLRLRGYRRAGGSVGKHARRWRAGDPGADRAAPGQPKTMTEGYGGIDVHRAARIAAPVMVVRSWSCNAARDLAGADRRRDLGLHRLNAHAVFELKRLYLGPAGRLSCNSA